jgi:hypothetical protein
MGDIEPSASEQPKPGLQRFFEAVAPVMGLDRGVHVLELRFQDGHLVNYYAHQQKVRPAELAVFDSSVERLIAWAPERS